MTRRGARARRLQDALREMAAEGRLVVSVAPFTGYLHPANDLRYLNYAIPDRGATAPWSAGVDRGARTRLRGRGTRAAPGDRGGVLAGARRGAAHVRLHGRTRARGDDLRLRRPAAGPAPDGVSVEAVARDASDAEIRTVLETVRACFAEHGAGPVTAADIAGVRVRSGGGVAAWASDGSCVGGATWLGVRLGVSEIVGVGVLPSHRGRGIASALTAAASRDAFVAGAQMAFLTPGDEGAQRAYTRAGFREVSAASISPAADADRPARPISHSPPGSDRPPRRQRIGQDAKYRHSDALVMFRTRTA